MGLKEVAAMPHHHHGHHGHHHPAHHSVDSSTMTSGHQQLTPQQMEHARHAAIVMQWAFFGFVLMAILYAIFERRRRRKIAAENGGYPARSGDYTTGLYECFCKPMVCATSTLFTPIVAAFNRAEVENRDCSVCDGIFAMKTPITQYHTRQSIRSANSLETAECYDAVTAVCCTPCAVAQDAIELERLAALNALPGQQMQVITAAAIPIGTTVQMAPVTNGEYEKVPAQFQV